MSFIIPTEPPFTVTSKPILPLDASLRNPGESLVSTQELAARPYRPEHYPPLPLPSHSPPGSMDSGSSSQIAHMTGILQGWCDSGVVHLDAQERPVQSSYPGAALPSALYSREHMQDNGSGAPTCLRRVTPSGRKRTSQACDKCRDRKTKCSGDKPVCSRCASRGLICSYRPSREPRFRAASKARHQSSMTALDMLYRDMIGEKERVASVMQNSRRSSASLPSSRSGSPIYGTFPRTMLPSYSPARPRLYWPENSVMASPQHVLQERARFTAAILSAAATASYDVTPRAEVSTSYNTDSSMFDEYIQLPPSNFAFDLENAWEYRAEGDSSGSEPPSTNASQISLCALSDADPSPPNSFLELPALSSSDSSLSGGHSNPPGSSVSSSNAFSPSALDSNQDLDVPSQEDPLAQITDLTESHSVCGSLLAANSTFMVDTQIDHQKAMEFQNGGMLSRSTSFADEISQFLEESVRYSNASIAGNASEPAS